MKGARALRNSALASAGFALAFASGLAAPFNEVDEPWFLQVVRRVNGGETLYRDVAFGATPLSVQVTGFVTRLFGLEAFVLRALLAAVFVATAFLVVRVAGRGRNVLLVPALFVFAVTGARPAYSPFAELFLLAAMAAALRGDPRVASPLAGVCAGLAFASKQNVGLYALAAVLVAGAGEERSWRGRRRRAALAATGFALGAALPLVPVLLSGGLPALVDFGFLGKRAYLELGKTPYLAGLAPLWQYLEHPSRAAWPVALAVESSQFLVPPLAAAALAAAWWNAPPGRRAAVTGVAVFAVAGFLGVYPRADAPHLAYTAPSFLAGLAFAWHELEARLAPLLRRALVGIAAVWIAASLWVRHTPVYTQWSGGLRRVATLPHFRGILVPSSLEERVRANTDELAAWAAASPGAPPIFVLGSRAGLCYLVTGLKNPTRFDFPWVTTFGRSGEAELEGLIEGGSVRVLVLAEPRSIMSPEVLERLARERMIPEAAGRSGILYRP